MEEVVEAMNTGKLTHTIDKEYARIVFYNENGLHVLVGTDHNDTTFQFPLVLKTKDITSHRSNWGSYAFEVIDALGKNFTVLPTTKLKQLHVTDMVQP